MNNKKLIIIILTFNSEQIIRKTILSAKKITNNILILDSFSTDKTIKIVNSFKCKLIKRKFKNYSDQRNYIIKKCNKLFDWQLHLDSDEVLSDQLIKNISNVIKSKENKFAYLVKRKIYFMKKKISFGGSSNWHLRLFPSKTTLVENTGYDQHFVTRVQTKYLSGYLHDHNIKSLSDWTISHNRWSTSDANTLNKSDPSNLIYPNLFGNSIERVRFFKKLFNFLPTFLKLIVIFIYKYIFRLGFLDGKIGFFYCFFYSWFRILIDAKKYEKKL